MDGGGRRPERPERTHRGHSCRYNTSKHLELLLRMVRRFPDAASEQYLDGPYFGENMLHIAIINRNAQLARTLVEICPKMVRADGMRALVIVRRRVAACCFTLCRLSLQWISRFRSRTRTGPRTHWPTHTRAHAHTRARMHGLSSPAFGFLHSVHAFACVPTCDHWRSTIGVYPAHCDASIRSTTVPPAASSRRVGRATTVSATPFVLLAPQRRAAHFCPPT